MKRKNTRKHINYLPEGSAVEITCKFRCIIKKYDTYDYVEVRVSELRTFEETKKWKGSLVIRGKDLSNKIFRDEEYKIIGKKVNSKYGATVVVLNIKKLDKG